MKKSCIIFILLFIIILTTAVFAGKSEGNADIDSREYFRIHVRADSNDEDDQRVKYLVKDEIVNYLTPIICSGKDKKDAMRLITAHLEDIEKIADETLRENGFSYTSSACVKEEEFPLRVYEEVTLPSGVYDSLIVNLGSGKGDNWWCVIYPPLCFDGGENVIYKSRIAEIIKEFFN